MAAQSVILVHGAGAGGGSWEYTTWEGVFAAGGLRCIAPELEPCAEGLAATELEDYVQQLLSLLRALHGPAPVLVGASLGGLLAMKASEAMKPGALVLVNAVPPLGTPGWPPRSAPYPDVVAWSQTHRLRDDLLAMPDADEATAARIKARWRDESGRVMRAAYAGVAASPARVPTLVVTGLADTEVPPLTGFALAERLGADFVGLAGVSHLGVLLGRRAAAAARQVLGWIRERAPEIDE